jgi:hypothetical protein
VKVGDLIRMKFSRSPVTSVGILVSQQGDTGDGLGMYWNVLFDGIMCFVREADTEVLSEGR